MSPSTVILQLDDVKSPLLSHDRTINHRASDLKFNVWRRYVVSVLILIVGSVLSAAWFNSARVGDAGDSTAAKATVPGPAVIVNKCTIPGQFALAFDDGVSRNIPAILAVLAKENVKATFFVNGHSLVPYLGTPEGDSLLQSVYAAGHQVGSHTYSHEDLTTLSTAEITKQMSDNDAAIFKVIGVHPAQMRLPYLSSSETVLKVLGSLNYRVIGQNLNIRDWNHPQPNQLQQNEAVFIPALNTSNVNKDSFISLQHDWTDASAQTAQEMIALAKAKGFKFVNVGECIGDNQIYRDVVVSSTASSVVESTTSSTLATSRQSSGTAYLMTATASMTTLWSSSTVASAAPSFSLTSQISAGSTAPATSATSGQSSRVVTLVSMPSTSATLAQLSSAMVSVAPTSFTTFFESSTVEVTSATPSAATFLEVSTAVLSVAPTPSASSIQSFSTIISSAAAPSSITVVSTSATTSPTSSSAVTSAVPTTTAVQSSTTFSSFAALTTTVPAPTSSVTTKSTAPTTSSSPRPSGSAVIVNTCVQPGQFALTFDDGVNLNTPGILAVLSAEKVKATFFVNGNNYTPRLGTPEGDAILQSVYRAGHQVASHSYTHPRLTSLSEAGIISEMKLNDDAIFAAIGVHPAQMRLPYLSSSTLVLQVLGSLNYRVIGVSLDTEDWNHPEPNQLQQNEAIFQPILNGANVNVDSFISLQHDSTVKSAVTAQEIIALAKSKGYTFVTVGECIGDSQIYRA